LCKSANLILAAGNKDEIDDFYELISLADRLSSVSKQLQGKYIMTGLRITTQKVPVALMTLKLLNIKSSKVYDKMTL